MLILFHGYIILCHVRLFQPIINKNKKENQHICDLCWFRKVIMKNDHRIAVTKKMITEALLKLLKTKPVSEITVKELCEEAHVNRATFYAHYENIYDLTDYVRQELTVQIIDSVTAFSNEDSLSDMLVCVCRCIAENADFCEIVFGRYSDTDFANSIIELIRMRYLYLWRESGGTNEDDMDLTYTFIANGGIAVIRSWVQNGIKQSPEYIAAFIEKKVRIKGFEE